MQTPSMRNVRKLAMALAIAAMLSVGMGAMMQVANAGDEAAAAADTDATLAVAHFAPFASEIVSTSVSVKVNGTDLITDFVFGERVDNIVVPSGTYTIEVVPTGSVTPAITVNAAVEGGKSYLLSAIGDGANQPLEIYPLPIDTTPFTATGKMRITHLSPFSNTLPGTAVDICTQAGTPVTGLTNIPYKATTGYLPLPAGIYDLKVAVAGTSCAAVALDIPPFGLAIGQVADAFAIGLPGSANLPLQISQTGLKARAVVAHFAPFANTITNTSVTVDIQGAVALTIPNFVFGNLTPYVELPLGNYNVDIIPTGTVTPAITGTVEVTGFVDYTVAAIGNVVNQPLELFALADDNFTPPAAGTSRVRVAHLAPFANTIPATRVDICAATNSAPLLANVAYKDSGFLALPFGLYRGVFLATPGTNCALPLVEIPPFIVGDGQIAYVYAVGDIVNIAPTVVAVPDLTPEWIYLPKIAGLMAAE
jgi:trimeric autotransporter adhesin